MNLCIKVKTINKIKMSSPNFKISDKPIILLESLNINQIVYWCVLCIMQLYFLLMCNLNKYMIKSSKNSQKIINYMNKNVCVLININIIKYEVHK